MGQWFSRWTGWLRRRRDPPVEEPVAVHVVTLVRESSSGFYKERIWVRGVTILVSEP